MTWTKEEIGRIIKDSRISAGLTQLQVAQSLGRPQNTISSWEVGRAQPDANTLFELFELFHRSVDEAFGFSSPHEKEAFSPAERAHIKKYRTLDEHGKEAVDGILNIEYHRCAVTFDEDDTELYANLARQQRQKEKKQDAEVSSVNVFAAG